ncbi:MAG: hypothetical protein V1723_02365 [Candidatus Uhrbacteria bacterium]
MATKDLARTFIEGGRSPGDRTKRRESIRRLRTNHRQYCRRVVIDPEYYNEGAVPELPPLSGWDTRSLHGTSAISRWLDAHVGRPWSEVYAKLCRQYDARSNLGRRMREEALWRVCVNPDDCQRSWHDYVVDEDGILRMNARTVVCPQERRAKFAPSDVRQKIVRELAAFCGDRRVGAYGDRLFWFVPVIVEERERIDHDASDACRFKFVPRVRGYRQCLLLDSEEVERWTKALAALNPIEREGVLGRYGFDLEGLVAVQREVAAYAVATA